MKTKPQFLNFHVSKFEDALIEKIVARAVKLTPSLDRMTCTMDVIACHNHGCPLDLNKLLAAPDYDFMHDLNAIHAAESKILTSQLSIAEYEHHVRQITLRDAAEGSGLYERLIRATATQRTEALLRTLKKWEE